MKLETRSYSHAVGEFNYHIQLTVVYRREIFSNEKVLKLTEAYLREKLLEMKVDLASLEYERVTYNSSVKEEERNRVRGALERYCELDTLAEVEIVRELDKINKQK